MLRTVTKPLSVLVLVLIASFADDVWGNSPGWGLPFGGGHLGGWFRKMSINEECRKALVLNATEAANFTAARKLCVANQTGLQALMNNVTNLCNGGAIGGHNSKELFLDDILEVPQGQSRDPVSVLRAVGNTTGAELYMKCIANSTGLLDSNGHFNMTALIARIMYKVAEYPAIVANTELGIANCTNVTDYNESAYMNCIGNFCETGAAASRK